MKNIILGLFILSIVLFGKDLKVQDNIIIMMLEKRAELNVANCTDNLPWALHNLEKEIGIKDASEKLEKLCIDGCGSACATLDENFFNSHATKEKACNSKIPYGYACHSLSWDEKDETKKLALKEKACKFGYTNACFDLAFVYESNKNYGYALKYYVMGCDAGNDSCCGSLGLIYATGNYGERSPKKAYEYWSKSVKLNPNNGASSRNLKALCNNNPSVCR